MEQTTHHSIPAKRLTLALAILTLHAHHLWLFWFGLVAVSHSELEWYYSEISVVSSLEVSLWRGHVLFDPAMFLALVVPIAACVCMFVCYAMLRKGKAVWPATYYILLAQQAGAFVAVFLTQMFTRFGAYWAIVNGTILLLSVFAIASLAKMRRLQSEASG